jgi:TetR/AcrR family transcriptional regulator
MSPRVVDREQRRREIALRAVEVFAETGFERTPVSRIAEAAGISKGSIYLYFESKADLFFSAVSAWTDLKLEEAGEQTDPGLRPADRLRVLVHAMVEAFIPDPRFMQVALDMLRLFLMDPQIYQEHDLIRELFQSTRKRITDILLQGVSEGAFRPEIARDAERIAINLLAYLDGVGLHYYMSKNYFDLMEQADFYLDGLLESIRIEGGREAVT